MEAKVKQISKSFIISFILSTIAIMFFRAYCDAVCMSSFNGLTDKVLTHCKSIKTWALIFLFAFIIYFYKNNMQKANKFLYTYRFAIAAIIFLLCVAFELTGSSIGLWCNYFGEVDYDVLLGVSRPIRSDEWAVNTPLGISQYYNYSGSFPYFSDTARACPTDMFLEGGQAVKNPLIIFRPFYWGYLFLPVAKGMAFFWCGRLIALFIVTFEFGMLIANKNKLLALTMAAMVSYAPPIQWWFANAGFAEMLIYTQLSILMLKNYMTQQKMLKRCIYLAIIVICAGGYVLTFYPPWMVPCAYILISLAIWVFIENRKICKMSFLDWTCILVSFLIFAASMVYLYELSKDTIHALMSTAYPGTRFETGGERLKWMFFYVTNIWHSIFSEGIIYNVCESSYFIDFFPICYVLPLALIFVKKQRDLLTFLLLGTSLFLGLYCAIGFPRWLSKITLLSNCQAKRVIVIFGFCNTILLIRALSQQQTININFANFPALLLAAAASIVAIKICRKTSPNYISQYKDLCAFITLEVFAILFFFTLKYNERTKYVWNFGTIFIILVASFLANPIRHGIKSIEKLPVLKTMESIHKKDPAAKWIVEGVGALPFPNAGLLVGAPTINCTNIYPNLNRWHLIDPSHKYEFQYNRYAHIEVILDNISEPHFEVRLDNFTVTLSPKDAKTIGASYIMTCRDLTGFVKSGDLEFIDNTNGFSFYKLIK